MEKSRGTAMDKEAMLYERNALLEEQQSKIMKEFDRVMKLGSTSVPADCSILPAKEASPPDKKKDLRPEQLVEALTQLNDKCLELEAQVKEMTAQLDNKLESQRSLDQECLHLERERTASQAGVKNTRLKLDKLERQLDEHERKLQEKELQNANLKKQRSELYRELERTAPTPRSDPSQIKHLGHDKETLKSLLLEAKQRRPLLQKQILWEKEERRNHVVRLDKQIAHLLKVYQKQTQLIVNLRKQKEHHMASGSGIGAGDYTASVTISTKENVMAAAADDDDDDGSSPTQEWCVAADNHCNHLQNIQEEETSNVNLLQNNHVVESKCSNLPANDRDDEFSNIILAQNDNAAETSNSILLQYNGETSSSNLLQNYNVAESSSNLLQNYNVAESSSNVLTN